MSKLDYLRSIRDSININIVDSSNVDLNSPCLFVSNHNCLMDIFYLPMSLDIPIVDMISSRLIYKKVHDRQKMVNEFLYSMPIEAHGGSIYSDMCLKSGVDLLNSGISLGIFPEGAYVPGRNIHRGRTGASRILYGAFSLGVDVNLVPVGIDVSQGFDLDSYCFDDRTINVKILPSVNYKEFYDMFSNASSFSLKNEALHAPIDLCMRRIAEELDRPYVNEYIELYPKGNVIFKDGYTVLSEAAQNPEFFYQYGSEISSRVKTLKKEIFKNEMIHI
jgi:1-acyl-sn-glycerol-3-phosphate acyltransferase